MVIDRLQRITPRWLALVSTIVFTLFVSFVLPQQSSKSAWYSETAGNPDLMFYYSAARLYDMAERYGADGRRHYIQTRLTFDVIWPLVYGIFLLSTISWFSRAISPQRSRWWWLSLLPLIAVTIDFLENTFTAIVMARYPMPTPIVAELAGVLTASKWLFVYASFVALLVCLVRWAWSIRWT